MFLVPFIFRSPQSSLKDRTRKKRDEYDKDPVLLTYRLIRIGSDTHSFIVPLTY